MSKKFAFIMLSIVGSAIFIAKSGPRDIKGKTWVVNQFYADSALVTDSVANSMRFAFPDFNNAIMSISTTSSVMSWKFSADSSQIIFNNDTPNQKGMKIKYVDAQHLVLTSKSYKPLTVVTVTGNGEFGQDYSNRVVSFGGDSVQFEIRMVPN